MSGTTPNTTTTLTTTNNNNVNNGMIKVWYKLSGAKQPTKVFVNPTFDIDDLKTVIKENQPISLARCDASRLLVFPPIRMAVSGAMRVISGGVGEEVLDPGDDVPTNTSSREPLIVKDPSSEVEEEETTAMTSVSPTPAIKNRIMMAYKDVRPTPLQTTPPYSAQRQTTPPYSTQRPPSKEYTKLLTLTDVKPTKTALLKKYTPTTKPKPKKTPELSVRGGVRSKRKRKERQFLTPGEYQPDKEAQEALARSASIHGHLPGSEGKGRSVSVPPGGKKPFRVMRTSMMNTPDGPRPWPDLVKKKVVPSDSESSSSEESEEEGPEIKRRRMSSPIRKKAPPPSRRSLPAKMESTRTKVGQQYIDEVLRRGLKETNS